MKIFVSILLGAMIVVVAAGVYTALEWAWGAYDDHDRGVWEGAVVVMTMNACEKISTYVQRRMYPVEAS